MDEDKRREILRISRDVHAAVEDAVLSHPATKDDPEQWLEKQRLLLADMAIHLLQTALRPGAIDAGKLKDNLHAILTISDHFLPHAGLKGATDGLYREPAGGPAAPVDAR